MSRYVRIAAPLVSLDTVADALRTMDIPFIRRARGVMLEGSLECSGEPVALRVAAGTGEAIEDFGFALENGAVVLVCGEIDREILSSGILAEVTRRCVEVAVNEIPGVSVVGLSAGIARGSGSGGTASDE